MKNVVKILALAFVFTGAVQAAWFGRSSKPQPRAKPQSAGCFSGMFGRKKPVVPVELKSSTPRSPRVSSASSTTRAIREANKAIADAKRLGVVLKEENSATKRHLQQDMTGIRREQERMDAALSRGFTRKTPSQEAAEDAELERELAGL